MSRKREKPSYYTSDRAKLADEIEQSTAGHDYDDWNNANDITFYNGEMRLIVAALRGKTK